MPTIAMGSFDLEEERSSTFSHEESIDDAIVGLSIKTISKQ
jgi:hypothetical protein